MSKHELLKHWPTPTLVRDVTSFNGFLQFYSKFIPCFELRSTPLRAIMAREYTKTIGSSWNSEAQNTCDELRKAVLSDPCLRRYDPSKLTILRTDFSAKGFGYVVCQPGDDHVSLDLVSQFMSGNGFHFLTNKGNGVLYPVAFGSHRARRNERFLHSYLGEAFCGDFAMNKFRHMCYGRRFVWVTDCYAVKFIMSYDGANQAILRLQMQLMGWDVDIVHRRNDHLVDADYWLRLDANLCYDPSFWTYLCLVDSFRITHPAPSEVPMLPDHMPYFRGPRVHHKPNENEPHPHDSPVTNNPPTTDLNAAALLTLIITSRDVGSTSLSI
jgi:hypothetical protein